jgi:transposase
MRTSVESYPRAAVERAMKVQEVILRAMAKKIRWWQAAEIIGISDRQMRRWRERYEEHDYDGLIDRRRGRPSEKRVPLAQVEQVLGLYREKYFDLNVRHFHEEAPSGARDRAELHVGEACLARGGPGGQGAPTRRAPPAARTAATAGHAAAHRRQPPSVVPG